MGHLCVKTARADRGQVTKSCFSGEHGNWGFSFFLSITLFGFVKFVKFVDS
jgi:hypothetical protein